MDIRILKPPRVTYPAYDGDDRVVKRPDPKVVEFADINGRKVKLGIRIGCIGATLDVSDRDVPFTRCLSLTIPKNGHNLVNLRFRDRTLRQLGEITDHPLYKNTSVDSPCFYCLILPLEPTVDQALEALAKIDFSVEVIE